jgi:lycopene beta-cyclase
VIDAVIVGAGPAGLSLAAHLAAGGWDDRRVVLVDDAGPGARQRSWGYWSATAGLLDAAAERTYDRFGVHAAGRTTVVELGAYRYRTVRLPALRALTIALLRQAPRFELLNGRVRAIQDGERHATVELDGHRLEATWVFDGAAVWTGTRRRRGARRPPAGPGHRMEFTGWTVRTARAAVDPDVPMLCDFRLPAGRAAFVHVLPQDARTALVEHTAYVPPGAGASPPARTAAELTGYLREVLAADSFELLATERGTIPLRPWAPRPRGRRVLAIGAAGGLVRASSGYGVEAIQRDSRAVVRSLLLHGHPFEVPRRPWRHRALDAVFLHAVATDPALLERAFGAMFGADPLRVLRFLDDDTTLREDARLVAGLPAGAFLRAALLAPVPTRPDARDLRPEDV